MLNNGKLGCYIYSVNGWKVVKILLLFQIFIFKLLHTPELKDRLKADIKLEIVFVIELWLVPLGVHTDVMCVYVQVNPDRRIPHQQVWTRHVSADEELMSAGSAAHRGGTERDSEEVSVPFRIKEVSSNHAHARS